PVPHAAHLRTQTLCIYPSKPPLPLCLSFNDPAPTDIYTLSLHDALPICPRPRGDLRPVPDVQEPVLVVRGRERRAAVRLEEERRGAEVLVALRVDPRWVVRLDDPEVRGQLHEAVAERHVVEVAAAGLVEDVR